MLCPLCKNETKSKNKGLIRHRTCRACGHEFSTIEVLYEPEMTVKQKLEKFMRDRKRVTDTATLAAYFMVAPSTINRVMGELENEGKIYHQAGPRNKNLWQWNYSLAVPAKPVAIRPIEPAPVVGRPIKATQSYPHVRGYDD